MKFDNKGGTKLEYSKDNTMTRKEYLKSKKKHRISLAIIKYVLLLITVVLLGIYVFKQLKVYNNVTQIANKVLEEAKLAKTMTMYYVSSSYTKEGKSSVMLYKSWDESRTKIPETEEFSNISIKDSKLYGTLDDGLYTVDLMSYAKEKIVEGKIQEYAVNDENILLNMEDGIYKFDMNSKELKQIIKGKVYQMVVYNNTIYVITAGKTSKSIIKYNMNGTGKKELSGKYIVSSMYISEQNIYFVNSKDSKIYSMTKSGDNIKTVTDNKISGSNMLEYKGNLYYINKSNENTLYHINLATGVEEMVVKKNIESIQNDGSKIYFKQANNIGIFKYDIETGKVDQITSARASEYICIN